MSNYLDQKLTARCAGWVEQRLKLRPHLARICRAPPPTQRCGLSGWPQAICWCHYLVLGQQDRVLQVVFYPNDQKTTVIAVKPHNVRLIKICANRLA